jgi:hypothetical protein
MLLSTATPADQKRPDFNGSWVLDEKRTAQALREQQTRLASGGDALLEMRARPQRLELKVDATSLTMTSHGTETPVQTWTLDGVDRSGKTGVGMTAEWKRQSIEIRLKFKGTPAIRTELSMDGAWLVVKDYQLDREASKDTAWRSRWTYYRKASVRAS